jgi:hypothetical protein
VVSAFLQQRDEERLAQRLTFHWWWMMQSPVGVYGCEVKFSSQFAALSSGEGKSWETTRVKKIRVMQKKVTFT